MKKKTSIFKTQLSVLFISLVLGVIIVLAIPFDSIYDIKFMQFAWAIIGLLLAFIGVVKLNNSIIQTIFLILTGLTIAQILRIVIEVQLNLSTHNLAGIEVIMVNIYLLISSTIGGLLGYILKRKNLKT